MNFTNLKYKANYYVLLLLAFVIPLERKLIAPATILFFITSIFNFNFNFKTHKKTLCFLSLFIIYLIGLIYSENKAYALNDLTTKLALFIIPICFFFSKINFKEKLFNILKSFVEGCFTAVILTLVSAGINYYFTLDSSHFFYGNISIFMHPSYFAMLLSLAVLIIYYFIFNNPIIKTKFSIILIVLFSIYILLLASKTGLISILLIHMIAISYWTITQKKYVFGIGTILLIGSSLLVTYKNSTLFKDRINELFTVSKTIDNENSTAARSTIWGICVDLIKEEPILGYGTGDVKDTLVKVYKNQNRSFLVKKELNAHNQFLQTSVAIGLIGGLILILLLIIPLYHAIKQKNILYIGFLLLIILNFSTEAMLERQVGVIFYALFNMLFFMTYYSTPKIIKE